MAEDRRTILKVLTGVFGGGAAAIVGGPAIRAVIDPVTLKTVEGLGDFVAVAQYDQLPDDGTPVNVPVVIESPKDAWNALPPTTVGAVFLVRTGKKVVALSTICPHLGCGIDFVADGGTFACPCHESSFAKDGSVAAGPSPRGMDELTSKVEDGKVLVKFEKFAIGKSEKVPA